MLRGNRLIDLHIGRFNGDPAALRHGVTGIDAKIEDDLLHLGRVRRYSLQIRVEYSGYLDVLTNQTAQHLVDLREDMIQAEHSGLQNLLAAKGQKLAGERRSVLPRFENFPQAPSRHFSESRIFQEYLAVPVDDAEKIVEIVRNSSGELTNGFHFQRLTKLLS